MDEFEAWEEGFNAGVTQLMVRLKLDLEDLTGRCGIGGHVWIKKEDVETLIDELLPDL